MTHAILPPGTLVFTFDESGDPGMTNPNHPVFAIGGVAFTEAEYAKGLCSHWNAMRQAFQVPKHLPLHANKLAKRCRPGTAQHAAVCRFFTEAQIARVAVVADKSTLNLTTHDLEVLMLRSLAERIVHIGKTASFRTIALIFEQSTRQADKLERALADISFTVDGQRIKTLKYVLPKRSNDPALGAADFVANIVAGDLRARARGPQNEFQERFESVFRRDHSYDHLQSYMQLVSITES